MSENQYQEPMCANCLKGESASNNNQPKSRSVTVTEDYTGKSSESIFQSFVGSMNKILIATGMLIAGLFLIIFFAIIIGLTFLALKVAL